MSEESSSLLQAESAAQWLNKVVHKHQLVQSIRHLPFPPSQPQRAGDDADGPLANSQRKQVWDTLDGQLRSRLMRLQLESDECAGQLERMTADLTTRLPRALADMELLRQDSSKLQRQVILRDLSVYSSFGWTYPSTLFQLPLGISVYFIPASYGHIRLFQLCVVWSIMHS
jgi:hypothetical protein